MKQKNQNEKTTSDLIYTNGIGTVVMQNNDYRDVLVVGYFKKYHWWFIIHSDVDTPEYLTVSEASTGRKLRDETYYTIEDALYFALPYIEEKRFHFSTQVGDILVKTQCNLLMRNTTNLQTLAIDSIWM